MKLPRDLDAADLIGVLAVTLVTLAFTKSEVM